MAAIGRHHADRQLGALPQILMRRLRRGHVEAVVEAVLEALQDVAFVLERVARHQVQLPRPDPHDHAGVSERATSSIRYASIRAPTFRSLKFSTPIPHSNPSRTTRTRAVRGMTPERTQLPAMVPTFAILKSWRTSASPNPISFFSGARKPAIAAFTSSTAS